MADFNIAGRMKISSLKSSFKSSFGSTLRVYIGNSNRPADDGDTVGKLAQKTVHQGSEVKAHGKTKVSTFEKAMKDTYGIRVQVANSSDTELVDNNMTLTASGKA